MTMACRLFGLTTEEALLGFTRNAARALRLDDRGVIEVGKVADLAIWDVERPGELSATLAQNRCLAVVKGGTVVYKAKPVQIAL
jgi:imidazolonepropionase